MAQKGKPIADQRLVLALSRRKEPKPATPVRSRPSPSTHGIGAFAPAETALAVPPADQDGQQEF